MKVKAYNPSGTGWALFADRDDRKCLDWAKIMKHKGWRIEISL